MSLIELMEYASQLIKEGRHRESIASELDSMGVYAAVIDVILDDINDDGSYRRTLSERQPL